MRRQNRRNRKRNTNVSRRSVSNARLAIPRGIRTPNDASTEELKCDPLVLSITTGTGTFTGTPYFTFDATNDLTSISTTRLNTYSEFRYIKITAVITPLQYNAAGSSAFAFVPQNGLASTASIAEYPQSHLVPNAAAGSRRHTMTWIAKTTSELNFNDTPNGPSVAPVVFGAYTDTTNFGTSNQSGVTLAYFRVDFYVLCQMRGLYVS